MKRSAAVRGLLRSVAWSSRRLHKRPLPRRLRAIEAGRTPSVGRRTHAVSVSRVRRSRWTQIQRTIISNSHFRKASGLTFAGSTSFVTRLPQTSPRPGSTSGSSTSGWATRLKKCVVATTEDFGNQRTNGELPFKIVAVASHGQQIGFSEEDRGLPLTVANPFTFNDYKNLPGDFAEGSPSHADYQSHFIRLCQSLDALVKELKSRFKAPELAVIASRMGSFDANRSTKDEKSQFHLSEYAHIICVGKSVVSPLCDTKAYRVSQ